MASAGKDRSIYAQCNKPEHKTLIEVAADYANTSVSKFVAGAALEKARQILANKKDIVIS